MIVILYGIEVKGYEMKFSSAHFTRLNGEFEPLHGHNFTVICRVEGSLNEENMVIDFGYVRKHIEKICMELDHKVLLPGKSSYMQIQEKDENIVVIADGKLYAIPKQDVVILPIEDTTTEQLAKYIYDKVNLPCKCTYSILVSENLGYTAIYFE